MGMVAYKGAIPISLFALYRTVFITCELIFGRGKPHEELCTRYRAVSY